MNMKMKLTELKNSNSLNSPRFVLSLGQAKSRELQISDNYDALTKLIGTSDVVINVDSSLLSLPYFQRESNIMKFIDTIRALNLEYKYQKFDSQSKWSIFSALFGNTNKKEHEIYAYIPNEIWSKDEFKNEYPIYGARYFILKENSDGSKVLEDMQRMLDEEKLEYFRMIVFNAVVLNSMGICSKHLTLSELKNILGIQ
ncbi:MAG: hypothetical protein ACM3XR_04015 [Bacillota bacterium]